MNLNDKLKDLRQLELIVEHIECYVDAYEIINKSVKECYEEFKNIYKDELNIKDFKDTVCDFDFSTNQIMINGEREVRFIAG